MFMVTDRVFDFVRAGGKNRTTAIYLPGGWYGLLTTHSGSGLRTPGACCIVQWRINRPIVRWSTQSRRRNGALLAPDSGVALLKAPHE